MNAEKLTTNQAYVDLIEQARAVLDDENGDYTVLKAFPSGIPFNYWQQYIGLVDLIFETVGMSLVATTVCAFLLLLSIV